MAAKSFLQELQSAIATCREAWEGPASQPPASAPAGQLDEVQADVAGAAVGPTLPSGEDTLTVLQEIAEDVEEYDAHVYRNKTQLERLGGGPSAWM